MQTVKRIGDEIQCYQSQKGSIHALEETRREKKVRYHFEALKLLGAILSSIEKIIFTQ